MKLVNFTLLFKRFHESLIIHESPVKYFWRGLFNVRLKISDLLERGVLLFSRGSFSHFHGGRAAISKKKILHIFNKLKRENCLECRKYEGVCQRKIFLRTLFGKDNTVEKKAYPGRITKNIGMSVKNVITARIKRVHQWS